MTDRNTPKRFNLTMFPLVPLPKKRCDYTYVFKISPAHSFPLVPLPKKRCDKKDYKRDYAEYLFPLVPLPKKRCDHSDPGTQESLVLVSISSASEEVRDLNKTKYWVNKVLKFPLVPLPKKCVT